MGRLPPAGRAYAALHLRKELRPLTRFFFRGLSSYVPVERYRFTPQYQTRVISAKNTTPASGVT